MKSNLKAKDLVMAGVFSLLGVVIMYVVPMPLMINPYGTLVSPLVQALFLAIVYFLIGSKIPKAGALLIFCTIMGLAGMALYYVAALFLAGIFVEVIMKKLGYGSKRALTVSYILFAVFNCFAGSLIPYIFFRDATYMQNIQLYGEEYANTVKSVRSGPIMLGMIIAVGIMAFLGTIISKRMLKKHFEKAGVI